MKQTIITSFFLIVIHAADVAQAPNQQRKNILSANDTRRTEICNINFGKNMITGVIHVDVPANVDFTINIYSSADHTLLFNSEKQQNFSLFPGTYDVEISGIILKNIRVNKGMDTRIKTGCLRVTAHSLWILYQENDIRTVHSSSLNENLEFPIGIYQLKINGVIRKIEIKDGETIECADTDGKTNQNSKIAEPVNLARIKKNKTYLNKISRSQSLNQYDPEKKNIIPIVLDTIPGDKKWEIKQSLITKGPGGRIFLNIPKEIECIITVFHPATGKELVYSGILTRERSFLLLPGTFNLKISGCLIKDVPVQKAMDTRIKTGILNVLTSGIWTLYDEKKSIQLYFSATTKKIGLPVGTYEIVVKEKRKKIRIKDGETLDFKINN